MAIITIEHNKELFESDKNICSFAEQTNVKPPHIIRALSKLEEKNIIKREKIDRFKTQYWLQQNSSKWRSDLTIQLPDEVIAKHEVSFKAWIARYPGPHIGIEDARIMYLNILSNGHKASDINDALTGYGNLKKVYAGMFKKKLNRFDYMYPTNFLKKWEEFLVYKDRKEIDRIIDPEKYVGERE